MIQTGSSPPAQTYSPDGRWCWDGREWQPVLGAPGPPPASPVPAVGRWLLAAVIVMVVLSALALALGTAVFAVRAVHGAVPRAAAPFTLRMTVTGSTRSLDIHPATS